MNMEKRLAMGFGFRSVPIQERVSCEFRGCHNNAIYSAVPVRVAGAGVLHVDGQVTLSCASHLTMAIGLCGAAWVQEGLLSSVTQDETIPSTGIIL